MTLSEFYDQVARMADTKGTRINVAETKRVLACFFDKLEDLKAKDAIDIISKGLAQAKRRRR